MDWTLLLNILGGVLYVLFAIVIAYFKTNVKLKTKVTELIDLAESKYSNGEDKKQFVIDSIFSLIPSFLRPLFNEKIIGALVQTTFDSIESYANKQLDKVTDAVVEKIDDVIEAQE